MRGNIKPQTMPSDSNLMRDVQKVNQKFSFLLQHFFFFIEFKQLILQCINGNIRVNNSFLFNAEPTKKTTETKICAQYLIKTLTGTAHMVSTNTFLPPPPKSLPAWITYVYLLLCFALHRIAHNRMSRNGAKYLCRVD